VLKCYVWAIAQREAGNCIISPFDTTIKRVTEQTAEIRNKMMIEPAEKITVGHVSVRGKLETLLKTTEKEIIRLV